MDRNSREVANPQRYHRGSLGQVLERYLLGMRRHREGDYSMVALEELLAEAQQHDPAIGLHLFGQFTIQDRHILALSASYCADLGEALRLWARYGRLASDMDTLDCLEDETGAAIEIMIDAPGDLARFTVEHYFVMSLTVIREVTGSPITPLRVQFSHLRPAYHAQYVEAFGGPVEFGAGGNRLHFSTTDLARPLLSRHAGMLEIICQELDRRLGRQRQLSGWAGKLARNMRRALAEGRVPGLEEQAAALHQSARTLRRRLEEQGLSFRQLLDLVRGELEQHFELQGLAAGEIAMRLGYGDLGAYQHARRRWREPE
ncbi:AraC family transcriptional regulator ligand-binding domain-containing protein [Pseudomonas nicosulfuronedens]|uniref:AraC family transcriptional regulator n=1 Tax=Pseudomonas nicosulfuronedens TaxID=2571105 RepID=A0A5R9QU82_9PSED|nr:AraC family transcriptional regulator ligand-binding domain-containing protein [Pseudomonas nicosulfuronedens]MDH1010100.1 AraC family transcriptional regulator ligand-binding domain-containing protein [Pseudomonas nicosulfuronedens]MDH1980116.1 AraC family transcriptional regulator ligand-binding domain-containing protein [Pseudomonas nicosulfuronedens]MDH2025335.1 AraC family transcriptional regulator ligand-binding domain-containing protein [Pseudomonas nicosulfuronedens]TLX73618.1 AraC f